MCDCQGCDDLADVVVNIRTGTGNGRSPCALCVMPHMSRCHCVGALLHQLYYTCVGVLPAVRHMYACGHAQQAAAGAVVKQRVLLEGPALAVRPADRARPGSHISCLMAAIVLMLSVVGV
jgi:hypothetical protein